MSSDFANALLRHRESRRRRMLWRGGRINNDRQAEDVVVEEGNYRPKNTSGEPKTNDPEEMLADSYADGGEVHKHVVHEHEAEDVTEKNKDQVADEHGEVMRRKKNHPAMASNGGMYADGGEVHEEHVDSFGPEKEEDHGGDVMKMAQILKRRRRYR